MCSCVCKYAHIHMHVPVSTAISLAWSHEVNPGCFHQLQLREGRLGQTSDACVGATAPEQDGLRPERMQELVRQEVGGEEEGEEGAEAASSPCASWWILSQPWRGIARDGLWSRRACVSCGFG